MSAEDEKWRDRRKHERFATVAECRLIVAENEEYSGAIENISEGGLFIQLAEPMQKINVYKIMRVIVTFDVMSKDISIDPACRIIYNNEQGVGVAFEPMTDENLKNLNKIIKAHKQLKRGL